MADPATGAGGPDDGDDKDVDDHEEGGGSGF